MNDPNLNAAKTENENDISSEVDWSHQRFSDLEKTAAKYQGFAELTRVENILFSRWTDIDRFLSGDGIWPAIELSNVYVPAITEVLTRLPEQAFDYATEHVRFVFQPPDYLALNVRLMEIFLPNKQNFTFVNDTIILFSRCLMLSDRARVGLIAHEIAHSFVAGKTDKADEKAADALAEKWGFSLELRRNEAEKRILFGS